MVKVGAAIWYQGANNDAVQSQYWSRCLIGSQCIAGWRLSGRQWICSPERYQPGCLSGSDSKLRLRDHLTSVIVTVRQGRLMCSKACEELWQICCEYLLITYNRLIWNYCPLWQTLRTLPVSSAIRYQLAAGKKRSSACKASILYNPSSGRKTPYLYTVNGALLHLDASGDKVDTEQLPDKPSESVLKYVPAARISVYQYFIALVELFKVPIVRYSSQPVSTKRYLWKAWWDIASLWQRFNLNTIHGW